MNSRPHHLPFDQWTTAQLTAYALECLGEGGKLYYQDLCDQYPRRRRRSSCWPSIDRMLGRTLRAFRRAVKIGEALPVEAALLAAVLAMHERRNAPDGWGVEKAPTPPDEAPAYPVKGEYKDTPGQLFAFPAA